MRFERDVWIFRGGRWVFLTADDVAAMLNFTADTIRRLAAAGQMPARKIAGRWRFEADQVRAYVRGEWHSTSELPAGPGGLDSQYAVALFGSPVALPTSGSQKSTRPRFEIVTGGKSS